MRILPLPAKQMPAAQEESRPIRREGGHCHACDQYHLWAARAAGVSDSHGKPGFPLLFLWQPLHDFVGPNMTSRRISRRELLSAASDVGPGDGVDPRYDRKGGRPTGRKTLQLCSQVMQTLAGVLAEQADDVLRDLLVVDVKPAGGGRMLVTVAPAPSAAVRDPAVLLHHLAQAHGLLRSEVAASIHRRKAPDLLFRVQLRRLS